MGDHVSMIEAQFLRLASMRSGIFGTMKMAMIILSLADWPDYGPMIPSVNTLQKDLTKWNYISMVFIEESNILAMNKEMDAPLTELALTHTKESDGSVNVARSERQKGNRIRQIRCFTCGRLGHMMKDFGKKERSNELVRAPYHSTEHGVGPKRNL